MQKIQKFGGAMFTPVLLFAFAGISVGIGTLFTTQAIMGSLAAPTSMWYKCWNVFLQGGWTVFNQLPLLFAVSLPIGMAKKQNARCCMEALVLYMTFHYFVNTILTQWGGVFGVNMNAEVGGTSGLAMIASIKTLDMGMVGALAVSGIVIYLHNRFFDTELPEWLGSFSGSTFVFMIGFFVMIPVAALAFYSTAKPEKKKKVFALLLPITLTAIVCGVTEPIEFTFLFVAPMLFVVHAFLAATLATTMWLAGIVGINSGGLIEIASLNLIPLMRNHWQQYLLELVIGLIFTAIWFVVFRFLILKFDFKTPGREDEAEIEFGSKEKFRNKQAEKGGKAGDPKLELCELILEGLGGKDNIVDVTNCATRLRVNVKDETLCKDDPYFKAIGTHGCSINGKAYQVIIGLKVPSIREVFETLL